MKANINEYITETLDSKISPRIGRPLPRVTCVDGFSMSIQVGTGLYSEQQKTSKKYSKVEIGYPSEHEPLIDKWAENCFDEEVPNYTDTVYPYVPVRVVDKVLKKHGGIVT
jgi:hypothetical protein